VTRQSPAVPGLDGGPYLAILPNMPAVPRLARARRRAAVIKALAHPSRLMIADALAAGERNVGELTTLVGADVSTVSKHLALLKNVGLVDADKRGQAVYYRLHCDCFAEFLGCVDTIARDRTAHLRRGMCC
jgi:DNA-binding transcriptional ArsR family regulator